MPQTLDLYRRLAAKPLGKQLFSKAYAFKAPYFRSVRPQVRTMEPGRGEVVVRKRRSVQNHIGTLHALAVANGLEAAMGLACEATVPEGMRWIPKGIQLEYITKVPGDVLCRATTEAPQWEKEPPFQVDVACSALLRDGTEVVRGVIPVWVTAKH